MATGSEDIAWLTVQDVARKLDLAPKSIYLMAGEGCPADRRIPSHRLGPRGGKLRFHPDDVAAYIESRRAVVRPSHRELKELRPRVGSTPRRP
jgi:hypothetical protein